MPTFCVTRWEAWFVVSVKAMIEDVGGHQTRFPEGDGMLRSHTRDPSGLRRRVAEFDLLPAFNLGPKQVGTTDEVVVQVEERVETESVPFPVLLIPLDPRSVLFRSFHTSKCCHDTLIRVHFAGCLFVVWAEAVCPQSAGCEGFGSL